MTTVSMMMNDWFTRLIFAESSHEMTAIQKSAKVAQQNGNGTKSLSSGYVRV